MVLDMLCVKSWDIVAGSAATGAGFEMCVKMWQQLSARTFLLTTVERCVGFETTSFEGR